MYERVLKVSNCHEESSSSHEKFVGHSNIRTIKEVPAQVMSFTWFEKDS